jgi:PAS domain S-box-containing protein
MNADETQNKTSVFGRLKIGTKILIVTVLISITIIGAIGIISDLSTRGAFEYEAFNKLTAVREMKGQQIEEYFDNIAQQIRSLSQSKDVIKGIEIFNISIKNLSLELYLNEDRRQRLHEFHMNAFSQEYQKSSGGAVPDIEMKKLIEIDDIAQYLQSAYLAENSQPIGQKNELLEALDDSYYSTQHRLLHPFFKQYLEKFGFYDIFLIDNEDGRIIYSVFKEIDFGTSLLTGPYQESNLARAFNAARVSTDPDFVAVVDFEPYVPSYSAPAAFMASPIIDDGRIVGVLAFQMPVDQINDIMTSRQAWKDVGLGLSGETYLVGADKLLRNQSRFLIEDRENYLESIRDLGIPEETVQKIDNLDSTIGLQIVDTEGTRAALAGESSTRIFPDYRGVPVLSSFRPLNLQGLNWVIISEIDEAEAFQPFDSLRDRMIMLTSVLLALTIYISYFFSLNLTRPLRFLEASAHALSEGRLDESIKRSSNDEIGDLALSFETMRVALKQTFAEVEQQKNELEDRVRDRTAELDNAFHQQERQTRELEQRNIEMLEIQEDLQRSEKEQIANKERIDSILQASPDGICAINAEGIVILVNHSMQTLFGYSSEEVTGMNVKVLMPDDMADRHHKGLERIVLGREPRLIDKGAVELEGRTKSGELFPIELSLSQIGSGNDGIFVGIIRDITERQKAERELAEKEAQLRLAFDNMPAGIKFIDKDLKIIAFNQQYLEVMGYPANLIHEGGFSNDELKFQAERGDLGPGNPDALVDKALAKHGGEKTVFIERELAEGRVAAITIQNTPDGQRVTVVNDITERKKAEETIKRRAMEASLLHRATQLAAESDAFDQSLQQCVDLVCELTGWAIGHVYLPAENGASKLVSASIWKIADPKKYAEFKTVSEQAVFQMGEGLPGRIWQTGDAAWIPDVTLDSNFPRKDICKQLNIHAAFGFPIEVRDEVVAVLEFFSEEVVTVDERLMETMATVGIQVGQVLERKRTADELSEARDAADEANRTKSAFLANMSHELRTPMNAILGYAEMLAEDAEENGNDDQLADLKEIMDAGEHLLTLVNDVLDISKIEAGRMDLYLETFDLTTMIDDVASTTKALVDKNNNKMAVSITDGIGEMHADVTKIRQILFNLMSNAAKFTSKGTITLFGERRSEKSGDIIRLGVADDGIGIPEDKLERIFEEFSQADDSTTKNFGGTGLGLALVKKFCHMMGGDIWVESTVGDGSSFILELPAIVIEMETAVETQEDISVSETDKLDIPTGDGSILVIDDDHNARDLIKRSLESEGHNVTVAADGDEGLVLARSIKPSLITLDIIMPGRDGWSVLQELKDDPGLRDIPVIMVSMIDDKKMGSALGAVDHLSKPVDRSKLKTLVKRYSKKGRALVVEDDDGTREVVSRALASIGWTSVEAENGAVGIEKFGDGKFDLIILDIMMPVMDGFGFIRELRKTEKGRSVSVVVLTSKDLTKVERKELNGNVEEVFLKEETSIDDLVKEIGNLLAR